MNTLEVFKKKLNNRNYSARTIKTYVFYLSRFLKSQNKSPSHITFAEITKYLLDQSYTSTSQQNQIIGSLKLYAKYMLNRSNIHIDKIERPKRAKKLPLVLDGVETEKKIKAIKNLKHRCILTISYSGALRISELLNLKLKDIDRNRMVIKINLGKGSKDRIIPINLNTLRLLEQYYRKYKPVDYLFNGQKTIKYTSSSCNKLVKKHLHPDASIHTLRHTCATHLHEKGVDIATISRFLGHSSVKTTMVYLRISTKVIQRLPIPM